MKFNLKYFLLTILIFIAEVLIATTYKNIVFLRSYFGDVLVVILIYTFILSIFKLQKSRLIFWIFIFSCVVEFLQYFHFAELLGLGKNQLALIVLGNSFSWIDIACYAIGCVSIWLLDVKLKNMFIKSAQK
ncbi:Protein of unknown function [Halpernia humi]|uniref:DUF2809 domain-containing protein n=1 Tax=Halpernia humi TaxID=493375 RepID=A0A1H5WDD9_9FLAO|nr:DUF2809 domain-containing protein [Halpernia humi]SEF96827.1 Protein of unknown function [Halpernia humi]